MPATTISSVVSPNGWHTASITQDGPYFQVVDVTRGPSTLNFAPLLPPALDHSSLVTTHVIAPPRFSSDSSPLTYTLQTDVNSAQQFVVPLSNPTSTSVFESTAASTYGQPVRYTAAVSVLPGTALPTSGPVAFFVDGKLYGSANLAGSNTASLTMVSLVVGPAALPGETAGQSCSATRSAAGDSGSYTYALASGALPAGLSLGSAGVLSGTATRAGTYSFTVKATDTLGATGTRPYTLTVSPAFTSFTVTAPGTVTAGAGFLVTVPGKDAFGNGYTGPVTLTSSNGQPVHVSPAPVVLTGGTVSVMVTLDVPATVTLTATNGVVRGTSGGVTVGL